MQRCTEFSAIAAKIAHAQTPSTIDKILGIDFDLEFKGLILHEAVVRNKIINNSTTALATANLLADTQHPLGELPINLLRIENVLHLKSYSFDGSSVILPFTSGGNRVLKPLETENSKCNIIETIAPERLELIKAAFKCWEEESNGKLEIRIYQIEGALINNINSLIPKLNLKCIGSPPKYKYTENLSAQTIFSILFSAAAEGGSLLSRQLCSIW